MASEKINFIDAYKRKDRVSIFARSSFWAVFSLIILASMLAALYFYIDYNKDILQSELDGIKAYVDNEQNTESYNEAINNENIVLRQLYSKKNSLISIDEIISNHPGMSKNDFLLFYFCCGKDITINTIEFDIYNLEFSFDAEANSPEAIIEYIRKLKSVRVFSEIEYNGYHANEDGTFNFDLFCTVGTVNENE